MPRTQEDFEEFAVARTPQLYRAAWLMCGDAHRAEDLVQETLAKVYVRWHRRLGGPIEHPVAYAHTTLTRAYISAQRRRSNHETPTESLPERIEQGGDAATSLALRDALAQLAPMDRAVLVLRYLEDVSVADTADALGVSPGAVRNRTLRALERLRAVLGPSLRDLLEI
ncbi:SigE family RNA polymerase sigma factor [Nocardioides pinisoli]|uniref:SigE family RNA polymerase sigma factor n=1 Tax=Nocardioides pinisoli TaxID=2950279 RepID=A0ABT1KSJ0_9ACTN|nr:SigE family RNA polymerase sigma factor [Nocardioides pinisoli]MCP3420707.1 SigE family RNA polymerase sigma factor [Nocardioides pinisoli]